jgi:hypothetical protein
MAAMLARAMSTPQDRTNSLSAAPGLIARPYLFVRALSRSSLKSPIVNLPTDCMFNGPLNLTRLVGVVRKKDPTRSDKKVPASNGDAWLTRRSQ